MSMGRTADLARGKWPGILESLGVPASVLNKRNQPCPACGGRDRFRFTDHDGRGAYYCSQCGPGDGFGLLGIVRGWGFQEAAKEVDRIVRGVQPAPRSQMTEAERMASVKAMWSRGVPVQAGDPVHRYLTGRRVAFVARFPDIRCLHDAGGGMSAMMALMRDTQGKPVTVHRTFIRDGAKAPIERPRLLMKGTLPTSAVSVRLGPVRQHIGVAEGIETAAAAAVLFGLPVWACVARGFLSKFEPPEGV